MKILCDRCGTPVPDQTDWNMAPELASPRVSAPWFYVGEKAMRSGARDGTIPSVKVGRNVMIPVRRILQRLQAEIDGVNETSDGYPKITAAVSLSDASDLPGKDDHESG